MKTQTGPIEKIYDDQINPLMIKVIKICKDNNIPLVSSFQLDYLEESDNHLKCTTALLPNGSEDNMIKARQVLLGEDKGTILTSMIIKGEKQ